MSVSTHDLTQRDFSTVDNFVAVKAPDSNTFQQATAVLRQNRIGIALNNTKSNKPKWLTCADVQRGCGVGPVRFPGREFGHAEPFLRPRRIPVTQRDTRLRLPMRRVAHSDGEVHRLVEFERSGPISSIEWLDSLVRPYSRTGAFGMHGSSGNSLLSSRRR